MNKYRLISKKGEGTFSEVLKAMSINTGKCVAIKCMKNHFDSVEQVNNLREIQALKRLSPHQCIIKLLEILFDEPTGRLALVFELMDMNMYEAIKGRRHYIPEHKVKNYMYQLLRALEHMHSIGIFHRDIKPENVLLLEDSVKLADFGSCRGIYSKQPYTEYISTRWYRAPECLLTDGYYNYKMDIWGAGCVFFEVLSLFPLFPGTNELDQVHKIHNILGTPPKEILDHFQKYASHMDFNFPEKEGTGISQLIPHVSPEGQELIMKLLAYSPDDRFTAKQALNLPYFRDMKNQDKRANQHSILQGSISPNHYQAKNDETTTAASEQWDYGPLSKRNSNANEHSQKNIKKFLISKKFPEAKGTHYIDKQHDKHNTSTESDDQNNNLNGLPPIKQFIQMNDPRKKKYFPNEYKQILKQTYSNHNLSGKKGPMVPVYKKISDHKKNYVSPYSQKAIQKF